MKIGVISDTHGSVTAWEEAYKRYLWRMDLILHCGDLLYHGARNPLPEGYNPKQLISKINGLEQPIVIVRGNCDAEVDQMVLDYPLESPYAHIITEDMKIFLHHGHQSPLPAKVKSAYDLIISGHTHLPNIEEEGDIILLNPGSPSLPKDANKTPTIATIEENVIVIWNLKTGEEVLRYDLRR